MDPTLDRGYGRRVRSWAFYDWADHGYLTTTASAFFPPYFVSIAAPAFAAGIGLASSSAAARDHASNVFAFAASIALAVTALLAPLIGAYADITGSRKRALIVLTVAGAFFSSAMYGLTTGMWLQALLLYGVTQFAMSIALGLNSSLLPHIAAPGDLNRVSSMGYAYGYVGGGLLLLLDTILYLAADRIGIGSGMAVRIAFLSVGVWWLAFSAPLIANVREPRATPLAASRGNGALADTIVRIARTLRDIKRYRELFKMLVAFWFYMEGIGAIILLATAFGAALGLPTAALIGTLLMTQFVAFPYSLIFGRIPLAKNRLRSVFVSLLLWTAATLPGLGVYANLSGRLTLPLTFAAILASQALGALFSLTLGRRLFARLAERLDTKRAVMLGLAVYVVIPVWGFFLRSTAEFFLIGWLVGTVQGGTQALSRSLYATLAPKAKSGEFFGLYGLSEKFAGILGPLLYAVVGEITGSPQASILSISVFFLVGILLLSRVRVKEGAELAEREEARIAAASGMD